MKLFLILATAVGFASSAMAGNLKLFCDGYVGSVQVSLQNIDDMNASIDVTHESPHGQVTRMTNTHTSNKAVQKAIKDGQLVALVSKSNLQNKFANLFEEASLVHLTLDKSTKEWSVQLSMNNSVTETSCEVVK